MDKPSVNHSQLAATITQQPLNAQSLPTDVADDDTTDPKLGTSEDTTIGLTPNQIATAHKSSKLVNFGDYELIRELGRGGMGVVYKAKQAGTGRLVALKLIRPDCLGNLLPEVRDTAIARFRNEVQATALLEHDHVVTVYDVGETDGQPFYAMRYVDGVSLKDLLSERPLEPLDAARYMVQVAGALNEAHSRGILHRDVKPHNVMIDRKLDRALLADFGLAKLTEGEQQLTASEVAIGSPPYMSPEQVVDSGKVTASTDIYGLGATLYHLLTGRPPFHGANAQATMMQVINRDPVAVRELNPLVPEDLETICLKCLEKTPDKRFSSIAEVADRLTRVIRGEPIPERPLTSTEKVRRWCIKNPAIAGLSFAVSIALIVGIITSTSFALMAQGKANELNQANKVLFSKTAELQTTNGKLGDALEKARAAEAKAQENEAIAILQTQSANRERERAETENRSAQAVRDFLQNNLLRGASPWEQVNLLGDSEATQKNVSEVSVLDLLNRAAEDFSPEKIAEAFPGQPHVQAEVLATIGETYGALGENTKSVAYVQSAFNKVESVYGKTHRSTLAALMNLGFEQLAAGQADEAITSLAILTERLDLLSSVPPTKSEDSTSGPLAPELQEFDEAYEAIINVIEKRLDIRRFVLPAVSTNLGARAMSLFRIVQGIPKLQRLVDTTLQRYGERDRRYLFTLMAYGFSKHAVGNVANALMTYEKVLEGAQQILEPDHTLLIGCRTILSVTYDTLGRDKEKSRTLREDVYESLVRLVGPTHPATLTTQLGLANKYFDDELYENAIALYEAGRPHWETRYGINSEKTLHFLHNLASAYHSASRYDDAANLFLSVVDGKTKVQGRDHADTHASIYCLANVYKDQKRFDDSIKLREEVLAADLVRLGQNNAETHETLRTLANDYESVNQFEKSIERREQLLQWQTRLLGEKASATLSTMEHLARTFTVVGRTENALDLQKKITSLLSTGNGSSTDTVKMLARVANNIKMLESLIGQTAEQRKMISNCRQWRWIVKENAPVREFRFEDDQWREFSGDAKLGTLSELMRTDTFIDLHDADRDVYLRLSADQVFASRRRLEWGSVARGGPIQSDAPTTPEP